MCRFTVRAPPAGGPAAQPPDLKLEAPLDLDVLFEHVTEDLDANGAQGPVTQGMGHDGGSRDEGPSARLPGCPADRPARPAALAADLALLALFSGNNAPAPAAEKPSPVSSCAAAPTADASNTVVMGQALCVPAGPQGVLPVAPPAAVPIAAPANPANPVQQLQFQAVMQHQAAIMQNPQAYPAAAQMYQQAMLQQQQQQQMLAAQQQVAAAAAAAAGSLPVPAPMLMGKRSVRSQEEVEEQTERIKKRRRESAQRRCAAAPWPRLPALAASRCCPARPPPAAPAPDAARCRRGGGRPRARARRLGFWTPGGCAPLRRCPHCRLLVWLLLLDHAAAVAAAAPPAAASARMLT